MNALLTMSSFIFPLISFPYVSRILGPTGTGKVNFATSFIAYFSMFAQLGIPTYGIRACARVRDDKQELTKVAQELLIINLITTLISYVGLFICIILVPRLQSDRELYIIISFSIILKTIGMEWVYKALEQYSYITIRSIVFKFVAVIAMFLLIRKEEDYIIYGGLSILAASASNIFNFINIHKYIGLKPVGNYDFNRHIKPILVFFGMSIAATIYTNLDSVVLGFMASDADVGYYSAAIKIKNILVSLVTSLGTVLLPRVSYYIENKQMDEFKRIYEKALDFVFVVATPITIYFILFAKEGIYFLSGELYADSIIPMQIVMPTVILIGLSNITGIQILIPLGLEKIVLYSQTIAAIVDCIINVLLIPQFKSIGAAIAILSAEAVVLLYQYIALKKNHFKVDRKIGYLAILIGVIIASIASLPIKLLGFNSFFTLLPSAIVFFGIYLITITLMKETLIIEIETQLISKVKEFKNMCD